jgi:hypothetical protein
LARTLLDDSTSGGVEDEPVPAFLSTSGLCQHFCGYFAIGVSPLDRLFPSYFSMGIQFAFLVSHDRAGQPRRSQTDCTAVVPQSY